MKYCRACESAGLTISGGMPPHTCGADTNVLHPFTYIPRPASYYNTHAPVEGDLRYSGPCAHMFHCGHWVQLLPNQCDRRATTTDDHGTSVKVDCPDCEGEGEIGRITSLGLGTDGMGNVEFERCDNCDGFGWLWEDDDGQQRRA